ncbi:carboxylesterase family protein [Nocardiopsis sp. RSe5-2]|uniref:Carboxylic ester hydrolase n=1 Tax=Nocardiopsis endophytica TaxID=3018445 RepID=A0ABT4U283_9ACTN|nr:carboxylesterase family protein [Nocardiopsis endophytica]MDA2810477.1 carboxylesterase family protein [Nocardiopsis endophytica]
MQPVVDTVTGRVRGAFDGGVAVFRGIPYAAPPVGDLRFRPPRHPAPWDDVRDATVPGPTPPAPPPSPDPALRPLLPDRRVPGDDYLNLDVWTPDPGPGAGGLPVMVWIPGDGFHRGSGAGAGPGFGPTSVTDGAALAREGVVAVAIHHRVGAEGFALIDGGTPNVGLLDQIHALEWVRDNIERFGGDPRKVTVFGHSSGAMSAVTLMAVPRARGLFRRVIAQSGAGHHAIRSGDARRVAAHLARRAGVRAASAAVLSRLPAARLLDAQASIADEFTGGPDPAVWGERLSHPAALPFAPVVDGELVTRRPVDGLRAGDGAEVDLLIGTTSEEFRRYAVPAGTHRSGAEKDLADAVARLGLEAKAAAVYTAEHPGGPGEAHTALLGDAYFRIPAYRVLEARSRVGVRAYGYEFAWRSPGFGGELGACHGVELPFLFDTLPRAGELVGDAPPERLSGEIRSAWVRFARTGDPGWAPWNPVSRPVWRFADPESSLVEDPGAETRRLWDAVPATR